MTSLPTQEDVLGYLHSLSNAGRWGEDDEAGTLNFVTDEKRLAAARLITTGEAVSLAWDIDTTSRPGEIHAPFRLMAALGDGLRLDAEDDKHVPERSRQGHALEMIGLVYHGPQITHIDSLAHQSFDGMLYNGFVADAAITPLDGARKLDVRAARNILTRGILIDVPRHRDVEWMPDGDLLTPDELDAILVADGIDLAEGDILFLRTGNGRWIAEQRPARTPTAPGPGGFHVANMPRFHAAGIAAIAADMGNDRKVSDYPEIRNPVHAVAQVAMGMWVIDHCNLEAVADVAYRHGTTAFAVAITPIPFVGATGSPIAPMAIF